MNASLPICAARVLALAGLAAVTTAPAAHSALLPGPVPALVERVVDGDTVAVKARVWVDTEVSVHVRIAGIDAPELFRPRCPAEAAAARASRDFVADWLAASEGAVTLADVDLDKYGGRVVARLARASDGADLGADIANAGHAILENAAEPWCVG